jgi:hypothetical protein
MKEDPMPHDFSALKDRYRETIEAMPATFTSHEFILRLAQQHQALYIEALYDHRDNPAPFRTVYGILAKYLHAYSDLIELVRDDALSTNIFGQPNRCAQWRKLG